MQFKDPPKAGDSQIVYVLQLACFFETMVHIVLIKVCK
jgi:hypothetical protein